MSRRTGRPNIGHATGRGVLPDGRISYRAILLEEETGMRGEDPTDTVFVERLRPCPAAKKTLRRMSRCRTCTLCESVRL
ncbi:hypothetical protein KS419_20685 [Bacillus tamaricis]|uniref:Uncharacterized protein n=1 Tax=Evansella tamaricis TaxID=2069301 RepID=A0ABS6JMT8_9BACI|nr:hypothetical protein [Evansella tamaricis]MBU9714157.1 hypothetical protein [Evansella tamaricis]